LKVAHLEITTNVTQEWDVADSGNYEEKERTSEDQHGEQSGQRECSRGYTVIFEVLGHVVPLSWIVLSQEPDSVQGKSLDGLTRSISQQKPFPT
jgi:hypothetical protein